MAWFTWVCFLETHPYISYQKLFQKTFKKNHFTCQDLKIIRLFFLIDRMHLAIFWPC